MRFQSPSVYISKVTDQSFVLQIFSYVHHQIILVGNMLKNVSLLEICYMAVISAAVVKMHHVKICYIAVISAAVVKMHHVKICYTAVISMRRWLQYIIKDMLYSGN